MTGMFTTGFPGNPFMTGSEVLPADETPSDNTMPQAMALSAMQVGNASSYQHKNLLLGSDFGINPWQRGTTISSIAATLTYGPDRWFAVGGASSSITLSRQAVGANALDPLGNRTPFCARVQRAAANADVAPIAFGTALTTARSRQAQGRRVALSFYARAGASFSPTAGFLGVQLVTGNGSDQSAANLVAGSWTGANNRPLSIPSTGLVSIGSNPGGNPTTGIQQQTILTPANGVALTTTWQRFQLVADLPASATQVGVVFTMTPVGTAGANDWFDINLIQLEVVSTDYPFATPFEFRAVSTELPELYRFCYRLNEKGTAAAVQANGMISATNVQTVGIPLPVPMRTTPTVTVNAGAFRFNIGGTLTAVGGGFAAGASATQSPEMINVVGAVTATVGQATQLVSGASTWGGWVQADAEL